MNIIVIIVIYLQNYINCLTNKFIMYYLTFQYETRLFYNTLTLSGADINFASVTNIALYDMIKLLMMIIIYLHNLALHYYEIRSKDQSLFPRIEFCNTLWKIPYLFYDYVFCISFSQWIQIIQSVAIYQNIPELLS